MAIKSGGGAVALRCTGTEWILSLTVLWLVCSAPICVAHNLTGNFICRQEPLQPTDRQCPSVPWAPETTAETCTVGWLHLRGCSRFSIDAVWPAACPPLPSYGPTHATLSVLHTPGLVPSAGQGTPSKELDHHFVQVQPRGNPT